MLKLGTLFACVIFMFGCQNNNVEKHQSRNNIEKEDDNWLYIDGQLSVCLPNCRDAGEAARVVLHGMVGHLSLCELIGEEHYDTFLA